MNPVKNQIKRLFVSLFFFGCPKIVVASTGRAGSTMLFDAIADSLIRHRFHLSPDSIIAKAIKKLSIGYIDRICDLSRGDCQVCKTHDTYERQTGANEKYIFVYGDPLDSVMSVRKVVDQEGEGWFDLHQYHLKGHGKYSDIYQEDVLNYQGQIESWLSLPRENVICVEYDDLWNKKTILDNFLGFHIALPARRPRLVKPVIVDVNNELFERLRELKTRLKAEYEKQDDC